MVDPIAYLLLACSIVFGVAATGLVRVLAIRFGFVDKPNPIIPQHTRPVTHMGGIGVAVAATATLGGAWIASATQLVDWSVHPQLAAFGCAGLAFTFLGGVDDVHRLSARVKLALQTLIAAGAVGSGISYHFTDVPLIDAAISVAWIIVVINAVNVTDVCDGLVSGIGFLALVFWAHFDPSSAPIALALAGACLGFLFFNYPPARIFLGDTGSHLIGFSLAALTLMRPEGVNGLQHGAQIVLFVAPFLFEMTLLIVVRRNKGLPWWRGSPDHFSLRLQAAGFSRRQTDLAAWTATAACCAAAFVLDDSGTLGFLLVLSGVAVAAVACWRFVMAQTVEGGRALAEPDGHPLRVLLIHQNLVTAHQAGNTRPIHILAGFLERGWSVEVLTTRTGYLDDEPVTRAATVEREGNLTLHRISAPGGPNRRRSGAVAFFFRALARLRHVGDVDVVYCSTPPPQILLAVIASVWKSAPMVLEVRDLWPAFLVHLRIVRSWPVIALLDWLESLGLRFAHTCVSVSPAFSDYLRAMGCKDGRLTVIPSGADPKLSTVDANARQAWRTGFGIDDELVVLYAGSFNDAYAIHALLDAARQTAAMRQDVVWVFAGNGRMRPEVEAVAEGSSAIRYLGTFPKDAAPRIFAGVDVGVVSLADEPLLKLVVPGKLLDYMAAGLPVVCNSDGLAGAIVRASGAGVVIPSTDPARLAEAVAELADLPRCQLPDIGAQGRRWAAEHMSSAALSRAVADVVESAYREGQLSAKSASALLGVLGAGMDVLTRRGNRSIKELLKTDLSMAAERDLAAWVDGAARRGNGEWIGTPPMPALLSGRTRREEAALDDQTIGDCKENACEPTS